MQIPTSHKRDIYGSTVYKSIFQDAEYKAEQRHMRTIFTTIERLSFRISNGANVEARAYLNRRRATIEVRKVNPGDDFQVLLNEIFFRMQISDCATNV